MSFLFPNCELMVESNINYNNLKITTYCTSIFLIIIIIVVVIK